MKAARLMIVGAVTLALLLAFYALGSARPGAEAVSSAKFYLDFGDKYQGVVAGLTGLTSESKMLEKSPSAHDKFAAAKAPGTTAYPNIIIKRGLSADMSLARWRQQVETGKVVRQNGTIKLLSPDGATLGQWEVVGAWPARISTYLGPNELAVEEIELAVESITRTK